MTFGKTGFQKATLENPNRVVLLMGAQLSLALGGLEIHFDRSEYW